MRFVRGSDETRIESQNYRSVIASISVKERQRERERERERMSVWCDGCITLRVRTAEERVQTGAVQML